MPNSMPIGSATGRRVLPVILKPLAPGDPRPPLPKYPAVPPWASPLNSPINPSPLLPVIPKPRAPGAPVSDLSNLMPRVPGSVPTAPLNPPKPPFVHPSLQAGAVHPGAQDTTHALPSPMVPMTPDKLAAYKARQAAAQPMAQYANPNAVGDTPAARNASAANARATNARDTQAPAAFTPGGIIRFGAMLPAYPGSNRKYLGQDPDGMHVYQTMDHARPQSEIDGVIACRHAYAANEDRNADKLMQSATGSPASTSDRETRIAMNGATLDRAAALNHLTDAQANAMATSSNAQLTAAEGGVDQVKQLQRDNEDLRRQITHFIGSTSNAAAHGANGMAVQEAISGRQAKALTAAEAKAKRTEFNGLVSGFLKAGGGADGNHDRAVAMAQAQMKAADGLFGAADHAQDEQHAPPVETPGVNPNYIGAGMITPGRQVGGVAHLAPATQPAGDDWSTPEAEQALADSKALIANSPAPASEAAASAAPAAQQAQPAFNAHYINAQDILKLQNTGMLPRGMSPDAARAAGQKTGGDIGVASDAPGHDDYQHLTDIGGKINDDGSATVNGQRAVWVQKDGKNGFMPIGARTK